MIEGRVDFPKQETVIYGRPAAEAAAELAEAWGAERVLILASGTLNRTTDAVSAVAAALGSRHALTIDRMPAHTPRGAVIEATAAAREAGVDVIVTVGGGSVTDGAKAIRLALANGVASVEDMDRIRAGNPVEPPTVRQLSIPTTLSAGEFSSICGVTDERAKAKEGYAHPLLVPQATLLDPAITVHTPEWLFLSTGIRAVDHCVEGVCSAAAHPYGDALALEGLARLAAGLARVKADPTDFAARLDCQLGCWLSMGPLSTGVPMGASHGIGYVLGALHGVPHGHTSCLMLPATMRWNLPANAERQARAAAAMGRADGDLAAALSALIAGLGMPTRLSDVGIGEADFDAIAEGAMKTPWVPRNPRPIAGPAEVREILALAA